MTELLYSPKIKPEHLARKAIVYLRQSSDKQVRQNLESQRLQYEMAERVRSLGWKQVEIIDSDLGFSAGMASTRREGFERVLSWVALCANINETSRPSTITVGRGKKSHFDEHKQDKQFFRCVGSFGA